MKHLLLALTCLFVLSGPAHAERARMTAQETYELGLRHLKSGAYTKALEALNRVRTYYRDDPYALKAELAIAEIHFKKNEWDLAQISYDEFLKAHPRYRDPSGNKQDVDYVMYRLGLTQFKKAPAFAARDQTATRQAVDTWTRFGARFQDSDWRDEVDVDLGKAQARLARKELIIARFYERREAWTAVSGRIEPLLRLWPNSPDTVEALGRLGAAYVHQGDEDRAVLVVQRLQSLPNHAPALARIDRARAAVTRDAVKKARKLAKGEKEAAPTATP